MAQTHTSDADGGRGLTEPPRVSIVVPTYNRGPRLAATIESVVGQTYRDWELIIHDDGSTDDTRDVAAAFTEDPRVHVTSGPNIGVAGARNAGYAETDPRSPYVIFLDHDDVWEADALAMMVERLDNHPEWPSVHCTARCIDANGDFVVGDTLTEDLRHRKGFVDGQLVDIPSDRPTPFSACVYFAWVVTPGTHLIRRRVLEQVGLFDASVVPADDADLVARVSRRGDIGFIDRPLLRWRRHDEALTYRSHNWGQAALAVRRKTLTDPTNTVEQREAMRSAYLHAVREMLGAGRRDIRQAPRQVAKAAQLYLAYARAELARRQVQTALRE
jgi:glycosyltransferase involved in cell wall biosynthesis